MISAVEVSLFADLFASVAEEMGVALERTAYSPNIKERRDYSCALFDNRGRLISQAAHIPVHLGAMPLLMTTLIHQGIGGSNSSLTWQPGDMVLTNDPYFSGTHLPDLTLVAPIFWDGSQIPFAFVANRAHHADIGGVVPGSLSLGTEIFQEGLILPPVKLLRRGRLQRDLLNLLCRNVRTPEERLGDLQAQISANRVGEKAFLRILRAYGPEIVQQRIEECIQYAERSLRSQLAQLPFGTYSFEDYLDDDGVSDDPVRLKVTLRIQTDVDGSPSIEFDFTGSSPQREGPVNAPLAVTLSACYYVVRCLLEEDVPMNHGCLKPVRVLAPEGSVVNPLFPSAVSAGNVETSQRLVDVLFGALAQALPDRIPSASCGTMNNLMLGGWDPFRHRPFVYYETMGGGAGAGPKAAGTSAIQCHMTNTRNTPIEALETHYPLRVLRYEIREGSGGKGLHQGGDGIRREIELLAPATVTLITDRRKRGPYGLQGGEPGAPGKNFLRFKDREEELPGKVSRSVPAGAVLKVCSPGGGGWGSPSVSLPLSFSVKDEEEGEG